MHRCVQTSLLTSVLLLITLPSTSAQKVAISSPQIPSISSDALHLKARIAWTGNALDSVANRRSYEDLLLLGYAVQLYKTNPNQDSATALKYLNNVSDFYQQQRMTAQNGAHVPEGAVEGIQGAFDVLGHFVPPHDAAFLAVGKDAFKLGVRTYEALVKDSSRVEAQTFEANNEQLAWNLGERYANQAITLAQTNKSFQTVLDTYFGTEHRLNALSTDSYSDILRKNPSFAQASQLDSVEQGQSTIVIDLDKLRSDFAANTKRVLDGIDANKSLILQLDAKQRSLRAYLLYKDAQAQLHQLAIQDREYRINGARASVYMLSTLALLSGNGKLASQISTVGNSAVQVADAVNRYANASARLSTLGKAGSSVMLMASCVGAVLAVAQIFSTEDNPDKAIIDAMSALSKQIVDLSNQMHSRFDRVDQALSIGFSNIAENFRELAVLEVKTLREVTVARRDIAAIQMTLNNLDSRMISLRLEEDEELRAGFDREFQRQLAFCVGHDDFLTHSPITLEQYQQCQLYFAIYGAVTAKDALSTGGPLQPADDAQIIARLRESSPFNQLSLLAGIGLDRFGRQDLMHHVTNTTDLRNWLRGSNAYIALADQYPQYAAMTPDSGLVQLVSAGGDSAALIRSFSDPNFLLAALRNYDIAFEQWQSLIRKIEMEYRGQYVQNYDLWAGPLQGTSYKARVLTSPAIRSCTTRENGAGWSAPNLDLPAPDNLETLIPKPMLLAEHLDLGNVELCYALREFSEANSQSQQFIWFKGFGHDLYARKYWLKPAVRIVASFRLKGTEQPLPVADILVESAQSVEWGWKDLGERPEPDGPMKHPNFSAKGNVGLAPLNALQFLADNWKSGQSIRNTVSAQIKSNIPDAAATASFSKVQKAVVDHLDAAGEDFSLRLSDRQLDPAELAQASIALDSAKGLLSAYLDVSLSDDLAKDDLLRAATVGGNGLSESGQLLQAYRASVDGQMMRRWQARQRLSSQGIALDFVSLQTALTLKKKVLAQQLIEAGTLENCTAEQRALITTLMSGLRMKVAGSGPSRGGSSGTFGNKLTPANHFYVETIMKQQETASAVIRERLLQKRLETSPKVTSLDALDATLGELKRLSQFREAEKEDVSKR